MCVCERERQKSKRALKKGMTKSESYFNMKLTLKELQLSNKVGDVLIFSVWRHTFSSVHNFPLSWPLNLLVGHTKKIVCLWKIFGLNILRMESLFMVGFDCMFHVLSF